MNLFVMGPVQMFDHTMEIKKKPLPYFRTAEWSTLMLETEVLIKKMLVAGKDAKTVFLTASGTAAMEATIMNCFTQKDKLLVIDGGVFGHRFAEMAERHQIPFDTIDLAFGESLTAEHMAPFSGKGYTALLANIHETSTGQLYDARMLSEFCKNNDMYFIADAISTFLADEYSMEGFGIDVTILSSQKGLAVSPGMSIVVLSDRIYNERVLKIPPKTFYFDFEDYVVNQLRGQPPYTSAVGICMEIHDMLKSLEKEGMENRLRSVRAIVDDFRNRIQATELILPDYPLSYAMTPMIFPRNNASAAFNMLKNEYDIMLTPCPADLKDKVLRVGHLGYHTIEENGPLVQTIAEVLSKV